MALARRLAIADALLGISAGILLVALLSIYPTVKFLRWRRNPDPAAAAAVRVLHLELVGVVLILFFAAQITR